MCHRISLKMRATVSGKTTTILPLLSKLIVIVIKSTSIHCSTLTSSGLFDSTAPRVFKNLVNYGGDMWFYMKPYPSNGKSGSQQMENVYQGLKSAQIKFSHITVHIGDPQLWSSGSDANTIS